MPVEDCKERFASLMVLLIASGFAFLALWIAAYKLPRDLVPLKQTYDQLVDTPCTLSNGQIYEDLCSGLSFIGQTTYQCYKLNVDVQIAVQFIPEQYYDTYDKREEVEAFVASFPLQTTCSINQCGDGYQGEIPEWCPTRKYPVYIAPNQPSFAAKFIGCVIGMLPLLIMIISAVVLTYKKCCRKTKARVDYESTYGSIQ